MGSSYSNLKIYIRRREGNYGSNKYNVEITRRISDVCSNFEVVTHTIKYLKTESDPYTYNILLYNHNREKTLGPCVFGYYPSHKNELLKELHVYFSIFNHDVPFIISFVTNDNQTYNCLYSTLISAGWFYASSITGYSVGQQLSREKLFELYKTQSHNKKIQLKNDNSNKEVSGYKYEIGKSGNYIIIYKPSGEKGVLGSECLFNFDIKTSKINCPKTNNSNGSASTEINSKTNTTINQIDPYYLDDIKDKFFDGTMVYFLTDGTALVLDFLGDCNNKQYVRKDKNATYWAKENFKYEDDKNIDDQLKKLKEEAEKNNYATFILEMTTNYKGVLVERKNEKNTYTKYEHKGSPSSQPNLIFQRKEVKKIGTLDQTKIKTVSLDVYFLKVNTTSDKFPFLLVFTNENGENSSAKSQISSSTKENKKCYYFNNTENFNDWHELSIKEPEKDLQKKIDDKLEKIEKNGTCVKNLSLLRTLAFEIISEKEPPAVPPTKPDETPKRPPVGPPSLVPGTTVGDILGYVTAGLVVNGTIGGGLYGIYWYNTTIKLLT